MSLESQIAELVGVNNKLVEYFNTKKAAIDAAVSAAVAAAPQITRVLYVDQAAGSDDNLGTTASPFRTIQRAVDVTPAGGRCEVWLMSDYTLASHVRLFGHKILLRGEETKGRRLILNEFLPDTSDSLPRIGCFWHGAGSSVELSNLTLVFPNSSAEVSNYCALTISSGPSSPTISSLRLHACSFEMRGTYRGRLIGPETSLVALAVYNTAIPAAFAGRIVPGVAAGTESKTLSHVITNLSTL